MTVPVTMIKGCTRAAPPPFWKHEEGVRCCLYSPAMPVVAAKKAMAVVPTAKVEAAVTETVDVGDSKDEAFKARRGRWCLGRDFQQ